MNSALYSLLFALRSQNGKSCYVFPNPRTGKPFVDIRKPFYAACDKAGVKDFKFHDLRHTFASRLVRNGCDLNTVKELMEHYSITTTQRYLHSQPKEKRNAVESLAGQGLDFELECQIRVKSEKSGVADNTASSSLQEGYEGAINA